MTGAVTSRSAAARPRRGRLVSICALACLAVACGRKTGVRPPESVAPQVIQNLTAVNVPDAIRLNWSRPRQDADGSAMFDLGGFTVQRSRGGEPFTFLTQIEVTDRDRLRQMRRFRYLDVDVVMGEIYRYRVFAFTLDGYVSEPSNEVEIVHALPAATPTAAPTGTPTAVTN